MGSGEGGQNGWVEVGPQAKRKERGEVSFSRWPNRALDSGQARTRVLPRSPLANHDQFAAAVWAAEWCGFESIGLDRWNGIGQRAGCWRCPGGLLRG